MTHTTPASAFYTVADSTYYIGLVALINSLRLVGHEEPIYVADVGLSETHRGLLAEHVTLVETDRARAPALAKVVAPLAHPADVMVLIDADMIVTRSLTELIDCARPGKIVAFADELVDRFDERWSELLDLESVRRQPYMNAGLVIAEREFGSRLLEQIVTGYAHVDVERSVAAYGSPDYPFYFLEQDLLNAFLSSCPGEQLELLDHRLAPFPPFPGLRLVDAVTLRCAYKDGVEPFVLHHVKRKPWLRPTRWNLYSHLLARVLLEGDVALPLRREELPLRLQTGAVAWLEKRRTDALVTVRSVRAGLALRTRLLRRLRGGRRGSKEGN